MKSQDTDVPHSTGTPNSKDIVFLIFLGLMLVAVTVLGTFNFKEGQHVEDAKHNGEAWMAWLADAGKGRMEDIDLLNSVADNIMGRTICALGDAAAMPVRAMLKHFRHEFEAKINAAQAELARA